MIPRNRIDALPINANQDQVRRFLLEERRSRVPVYEGSLDNIVGYVSAKDIVALAWEGKLFVLQDLLRKVKVFPETVQAIEVLRFMRREHQRLAIAVDEHGVLSGMVTFEDLVEELVGEVFSEHEEDRQKLVRLPDGSASVRGDLPLRELNRELGLALRGRRRRHHRGRPGHQAGRRHPQPRRPAGGQRRHRAGGPRRHAAYGPSGSGRPGADSRARAAAQ